MAAQQKKVAILQSNYIPWKGYFDIIAKADIFVVYDTVQYTKRDWRNRNKIKTSTGTQWLTVPVQTKGLKYQKINETEVRSTYWVDKHLKSLEINYRKSRYFSRTMEWLYPLYSCLKEHKHLSTINKLLIKRVCEELSIKTSIIDAEKFHIEGQKSQALLSILQQLGEVSHYISGPAAKGYLDENMLNDHRIKVEWMDYTCYSEYSQLYPPFVHDVSVIDLLFNEGPHSRNFLSTCCQ
jgi:hypothetical protein